MSFGSPNKKNCIGFCAKPFFVRAATTFAGNLQVKRTKMRMGDKHCSGARMTKAKLRATSQKGFREAARTCSFFNSMTWAWRLLWHPRRVTCAARCFPLVPWGPSPQQAAVAGGQCLCECIHSLFHICLAPARSSIVHAHSVWRGIITSVLYLHVHAACSVCVSNKAYAQFVI